MMPFVRFGLDLDRIPSTYAVSFRGKLLPVLGALILFSSAIAASTPLHSGLMKPPVIDKRDIRFIQFSVNGESLQTITGSCGWVPVQACTGMTVTLSNATGTNAVTRIV
jgi:hypothetical protein